MIVRILPLALIAIGLIAQPQPTFEVASVRLTPAASLGLISFSPFGENRFTLSNASLGLLVQLAYGVPYPQITGLDKLGSEHYEVNVKAQDGVLLTPPELQPRLQQLLGQRFKLVVRHDTKDSDGYALVVAKGGAKLKPTAGGSELGSIYPGGMRVTNRDLSSFAASMTSPAGRPVIDKTGIKGNYDFVFTFAREGDADSSLPSFFTALQEQFGLKLETTKIPLEILVIDQVQKIPTEN